MSLVPSDTVGEAAKQVDEDFGARLRIAMKNAGLSQWEVARRVNERAGTKHQGGAVGRWKRGERGQRIEPAALFALADVLGVEARWLWLGEGPQARIPPPRNAGRGR